MTQTETSGAAALSVQQLHDRARYRRAVEAVIWGMPMVNFDLMAQAMKKAGGAFNQIVYWSRLPDWKNQTLTPNPDAIYLMPFFNTKDAGPIVLEIPPAEGGSITGSVDDCWQTAIEDVGPAGVDKGKGGKYLILPPDSAAAIPAGYIPMRSDNYQGYALLRSILKSGSDADVAAAVAYAKQIKVYPLSAAANPPATVYVDAINVVFDSTIPYDIRFFQSLDRMVQIEPWLPRDRVMIDMLKSIGIHKGKAFAPDKPTEGMLKRAAEEAHADLAAEYDSGFAEPFYVGGSWALPASPEVVEGMQTNFERIDAYPVTARAVSYSLAFFSAKHLGAGQYYLMTAKDRDGEHLKGDQTYRLRVPADAPVAQYWSATVYDRDTHAFIKGTPRPSRSSQNPDLKPNPDGSVDVYFGPTAPAGQDGNWTPTNPDGEFEVLFRLYGPEKALFDKTWRLPEIERLH